MSHTEEVRDLYSFNVVAFVFFKFKIHTFYLIPDDNLLNKNGDIIVLVLIIHVIFMIVCFLIIKYFGDYQGEYIRLTM